MRNGFGGDDVLNVVLFLFVDFSERSDVDFLSVIVSLCQ